MNTTLLTEPVTGGNIKFFDAGNNRSLNLLKNIFCVKHRPFHPFVIHS